MIDDKIQTLPEINLQMRYLKNRIAYLEGQNKKLLKHEIVKTYDNIKKTEEVKKYIYLKNRIKEEKEYIMQISMLYSNIDNNKNTIRKKNNKIITNFNNLSTGLQKIIQQSIDEVNSLNKKLNRVQKDRLVVLYKEYKETDYIKEYIKNNKELKYIKRQLFSHDLLASYHKDKKIDHLKQCNHDLNYFIHSFKNSFMPNKYGSMCVCLECQKLLTYYNDNPEEEIPNLIGFTYKRNDMFNSFELRNIYQDLLTKGLSNEKICEILQKKYLEDEKNKLDKKIKKIRK